MEHTAYPHSRLVALAGLSLILGSTQAWPAPPVMSCTAALAAVEAGETAIARDQQAIKRLGFAQTAQSLDEWDRLDEKARFDRNLSVLGALLSASTAAVKAGKSLTPPLANKAITRLRFDSGYYDRTQLALERSIRAVAATPGKPILGAAALELLDRLQIYKTAVALEATDTARNKKLSAISAVLGMFQTDPSLALLAADLNFATSSVYAMGVGLVHEEVIRDLSTRTVTDLEALKRLSTQLTKSVSRLKAAKARTELPACAKETKAAASRTKIAERPSAPTKAVSSPQPVNKCAQLKAERHSLVERRDAVLEQMTQYGKSSDNCRAQCSDPTFFKCMNTCNSRWDTAELNKQFDNLYYAASEVSLQMIRLNCY